MQRFARIVLDSISVETKSDAERRSELARAGKFIGVGLFHGTNEWFSDSLLQTLAASWFRVADVSPGADESAPVCAWPRWIKVRFHSQFY